MQRVGRLFTLFWSLGLTCLGLACEDDPAPTVLQAIDLQKPEEGGFNFDRNLIVESGAFTDFETLDVRVVQRFLGKTPYDRPSFLETYQSNGMRASDAIVSAARNYRINPLVFLVFAQTTQGLLGERNYPFPPERVEYVFRCGCLQAKNCLPALAGFDRQVDCLGRALRAGIDEIKAHEQTVTGWGPNKTTLTLDNVKVTPQNDATAALYDRNPRVNEGAPGGMWVYWNIWNLYGPKLNYVGPLEVADGRWIGEDCVADQSCGGFQNAICAKNYPGGLCTTACSGECPTGGAPAFCAKFRDGGFCFPVCNPGATICRPGYTCVRVAGVTTGATQYVCSPDAK
jgi:hypothetical protein